ncbi:hypothetical protein HNQ39_001602 [Armatimonas rosea]|uniref:Uncharacterized protein n=1 Tax=Armatimonas rosea TaxID=685828 RepID=A0A7W9SNE2_ARMRO|nr:hypothetical protein [Armatimonas rosea]
MAQITPGIGTLNSLLYNTNANCYFHSKISPNMKL